MHPNAAFRWADAPAMRACEDWTRAKMDPARFEAMLGAIIGFALVETEWRGTWKMSQNKSAAMRARVESRLGQLLEQPR